MILNLLKIIGVLVFALSAIHLVSLYAESVELTEMERYRDHFIDIFAGLIGMITGTAMVSYPWK